MTSRIRATVIAVLAALALTAAAACGADSSPTGTTAPTDTGSATGGASVSNGSENAGPTDSPIGDLLGIPLTDDDAMEEYFGQLQRDAEANIAECMRSQGFEYTPVDLSGIDNLVVNIDSESREYAEQYGFGITSNPFEESFEAFEGFDDPNQDYLESLSAGEAEAYQTALNGTPPDFDDPAATDFFEPGGCQGEAYDDVFRFGLVFQQFSAEFEDIEEAFYADPRIVEATEGWAACMADEGYGYSDQDEARQDIERRYSAIVNNPEAFERSEEPPPIEIETAGESEVFFGPGTLNPEFQERVDALAEEERAIGLASWDCDAPLRAIQGDVQVEYEQRFVDEHGAAIRAALEE